MLATEGLLEPLSTALLSVLDDDEDQSEYTNSAKEHILQIFLIYSSSEQWLKQQVATRHVLRSKCNRYFYMLSLLTLPLTGFLQACAQLDPESLTYMLKAIKGLTMSPSILDDIENCNAIEVLVRTLAQHHDGPCGTEISNQILNAMYNREYISGATLLYTDRHNSLSTQQTPPRRSSTSWSDSSITSNCASIFTPQTIRIAYPVRYDPC